MPSAVRMPRLGMSMEEGTVIAWSRALGERVEKGEILLIIESEKSEVEIEAIASGVLRHIYVEPQETVPCGTLLAALTDTAEEPFDVEGFRDAAAATEVPAAASSAAPTEVTAPAPPTPSPHGRGAPIAPAARALARDLGLDPSQVPGTGPRGRVTVEDVRGWAARMVQRFREVLKLSTKRRTLIRNVVRSKTEAPHFYLQMEARMDALQALRERVNAEDARPRLTYTHLVLKAAALALERFPDVNAVYRAESHEIGIYEEINIGLAVDAAGELVVPTVRACRGKSVFQLASEANALIERAQLGKLAPEDYADGTFTISNLGMFGVDRFYAIITPPQGAILSVGALRRAPVAEQDAVTVGTLTCLGLSVDHRVLDGARGARFLGEVKRLLESPEELL